MPKQEADLKSVEEKQDEAKEAAKKELKAEEVTKKKEAIAERTKKIREIQKKKFKTGDDKMILDREMKARAQDNREIPNDLDKMYPSQMTMEEMIKYCEQNKIEVKKGDSTVMLRMRIKAFRNPSQAERLIMLEDRRVMGKIVK